MSSNRRAGRSGTFGSLVLLAALFATIAATASLAPHHDGEDRSCLVCKAGSQPLETTVIAVSLSWPMASFSSLAPRSEAPEAGEREHRRSPRAPPA